MSDFSLGLPLLWRISFVLVAVVIAHRMSRPDVALCEVTPCTDESLVRGIVLFQKEGKASTRITCQLEGLSPGLHGMHVHRSGDFSDGCTSTCDHYNPDGTPHGGPLGSKRHRGDFGNIIAGTDGTSTTVVVADVSLKEIVGRALIIHAEADDLGTGDASDSTTTGHSGARVGGGVIRWR